MRPGDRVFLRGGTYAENDGEYGVHLTVSGKRAAPITWTSAPGEMARITVGGARRSDSLRISADWNVVTGLQVSDSGAQGVVIAGNNVTVSDCEIFNNHMRTGHAATGSGVNIVIGTTGAKVLRNKIHNNGARRNLDHGLYVKGSDVEIAENDVYSNAGYGIQLFEKSGRVFSRVSLHDNRWHSNGNSGVLVSKGADQVTIERDVSYANAEAGMQTNYSPVSSVVVSHVTSYGNGGRAFDFVTGRGVTLRDSVADGQSALRVEGAVTGYLSDFNLFWPASASYSYRGSTFTGLAGYRAASGKDAGSREADPAFTDPGAGDFEPAPGAPECRAASDGGDVGAVPCGAQASPSTVSASELNPPRGSLCGTRVRRRGVICPGRAGARGTRSSRSRW